MNNEYENARRHADNTLAEVNRHMNSGKITNPRHHQMLTSMAESATRTLRNLDEMENKRPYSTTNIGYGADMARRVISRNDAVRDAMDAINKILPHISDDYNMDDDAEMRQGVPGTGPYSNPRLRRRGGRKGIGRRRAEMDYADMDDRYDADDDMDAYDDDVEARRGGRRRRDSRGRFMRSDYDDARYDRYDDARTTNEHERRMHDAVTRAAADAAADTARRMANDARGIYPGTPVMPRSDDMRRDARYDTRSDNRADDTTSDRTHRPGPGGRE